MALQIPVRCCRPYIAIVAKQMVRSIQGYACDGSLVLPCMIPSLLCGVWIVIGAEGVML